MTGADKSALLEHGYQVSSTAKVSHNETTKYPHIVTATELESGQEVIVKKVASGSREIEILEYLNTKPNSGAVEKN